MSDDALVAALLAPGERLLRASAAEATMARAGVVAMGYALPALLVGWLPLKRALAHVGAMGPDDRLPFALFAGFGLLWIAIGLRLLCEPWRLHRLWPHVVHLLTDRRFLAADRRTARVIHEMPLEAVGRIKTFAPFGRVTLRRRGFASGTGKLARVRNFDGVAEPDAVARAIGERTGVPVGWAGQSR